MLGGYISLKCGSSDLSIFHWEIIVHLAWFSSITHLAGLNCIRHYWRAHPWERNLRITLILVLLVLLLTALIPTGFSNGLQIGSWDQSDERFGTLAMPAICYFSKAAVGLIWNQYWESDSYYYYYRSLYDTYAFQSMVVSVTLLLGGFFFRCIKIIRPLHRGIAMKIRQRVSSSLRNLISKLAQRGPPYSTISSNASPVRRLCGRLYHDLLVRPAVATFLSLRLCIDFIASELTEAGTHG